MKIPVRRILVPVAAVLVTVVSTAVGPAVADAAPATCAGEEAWFLGVVHDDERREDFQADVGNFEGYLDGLRATWCIPDEQATILAFAGSRVGTPWAGYADATEGNLKAELARMGAAASPDATFFFFLSSHGMMWSGLAGSACPVTRLVGSYAQLAAPDDGDDPEDGFLDDCELGEALTGEFDPGVRMWVAVDCSFCGGFSDSVTAVSGTVPDGSVPQSSGVAGPNRVVMTGCAITTECFGSSNGGGQFYRTLTAVLDDGPSACDGWTAPGFPAFQGVDLPVRGATDGRCTASEWFFAAVERAYTEAPTLDDQVIATQQQFRIKYDLAPGDDILIG
jgi:hypothetical protein